MINIFGCGFLGGEFANQLPDRVIVNSRNDLIPKSNKILYFISTVDNYNIYDNPHLDIDTNLSLLISVLENCKNLYGNEFEFNFVSSWFVYGKVPFPAREDSVCNPQGFYSITKRCAEQLLMSYCSTFHIPYRILRMANIIGIDDKKVSKKKNALQYMIKQLILNEEVSLYEGKILRDLIDVRDAARALDLVLSKGNLNEVYNIGNGIGYSFEEIVYKIQELKGRGNIKRIPIPEFHKTIQAKDFFLDTSKLDSLGYSPSFDVMNTLVEIANKYEIFFRDSGI